MKAVLLTIGLAVTVIWLWPRVMRTHAGTAGAAGAAGTSGLQSGSRPGHKIAWSPPITIAAPALSEPDPQPVELESVTAHDPYDIRPEARERYQRFLDRAGLTDAQKTTFDTILSDIRLMYRKAQDQGDYRAVQAVESEAYDRIKTILTVEQYTSFRRTIGALVLSVAARNWP